MRKIFATLGTLLTASMLFTSCLDSNDDYETTADAVITSFTIGDLTREVTVTLSTGVDSTYNVSIDGDLYAFSIDHLTGEIYNRDSLPKGTDVTRVLVSLGYDGYYVSYDDGDGLAAWSSTDSIDFTSPVRFTVYATDGTSSRTYYARLNVHNVHSDSLVWEQAAGANFQGSSLVQQKALIKGDSLYVFGQSETGMTLTATALADGVQWTEPAALTGLGSETDCASVTLYGEEFLLISDGKVYTSADGIAWTQAYDEDGFTATVAVADGVLYLQRGTDIVRLGNDGTWETVQSISETEFPVNPNAVTSTLTTNAAILRTTLVGTPAQPTDTCAVVWTKLSTESKWTYYNNSRFGCPLLDRLTVIGYDGRLYAFGGRSLNRVAEIAPFEAIYTSTDGGITWQRQRTAIGLPTDLAGYTGSHSCVVDSDQRIWLMAGDGAVYRGHLNRVEE